MEDVNSAIIRGDIGELERLLEEYMDVNCASGNNETPLFVCLEQGRVDLAEALVSKGHADPRRPLSGLTLIGKAAAIGNLGFVKFLTSKCEQVGVMYPLESPLALAVKNGHFRVASLLLGCGADPNGNGGTRPMEYAIDKRDMRSLSVLVACGADICDSDMLQGDVGGRMREMMNCVVPCAVRDEGLDPARAEVLRLSEEIMSVVWTVDCVKERVNEMMLQMQKFIEKIGQIVSVVEGVFTEIDNERRKCLEVVFKRFEAEDLSGVMKFVKSDDDAWKCALEKAKRRFMGCAANGDIKRRTATKIVSRLGSNIFLSGIDVEVPSIPEEVEMEDNRRKLIQLNRRVAQISPILANLEALRWKLEYGFDGYATKLLETLNDYSTVTQRMTECMTTLVRLGLAKSVIDGMIAEQENGGMDDVREFVHFVETAVRDSRKQLKLVGGRIGKMVR